MSVLRTIKYKVSDYLTKGDAKTACIQASAMYKRNGYTVVWMWSELKKEYLLQARA